MRFHTLAAIGTVVFFSSASLAQDFIDEDPNARVFSAIEVTGNSRFRDGDVLATSGLQAGEAYTEDDIVAAVEALEFTGEFKTVRIFSRGESLTIAVEEEPTYQGALTFGLGADSDIGVFGSVGLRLSDAFGGNTDLSADLKIAKEVREARASISSPDFWPGGHPGGVRFSFGDYNYDDTLFDFQTAKVSPYLTFGSDAGVIGEFRLTGFWTDISSVETDASAIVQAEAGSRFVAGPGVSLLWTDKGTGSAYWSLGASVDVYGGDADFMDLSLSFASRIPFVASTALKTRASIGSIRSFGGSGTTVADRTTLGGTKMRGFARGGISPRDVCLGCGGGGADVFTDLGGETYAVLQNDLVLPFLTGTPVSPSLYFDIGSVWSVDTDTAASGVLVDDQQWRSSAGIALTAETDLGDFSASYALTTNSEANDDTARFTLSFTNEF